MIYKLAVIGAGAAGMTAAVVAAKNGIAPIIIIEKNEFAGRKIYATGNGRCNISNVSAPGSDEIKRFFESIGVELVEEDEGRMYPRSRQAVDVVFAFENAMAVCGIECKYGTSVSGIERYDDIFQINLVDHDIVAENVIVACGGKAGPSYGTTGDGYAWLKDLGHTLSTRIPVLTGVEIEGDISYLSGNRSEAIIKLEKNGIEIFKEFGEVQFTRYGVSGICVFDLSRHLLKDENDFSNYKIVLDLVPEKRSESLISTLKRRRTLNGLAAKDILRSIINKDIAEDIYKGVMGEAGDTTRAANEITDEELISLATHVKEYSLNVRGARGWQMAQTTKGGVILDEINMETMESKVAPGLFLAGEVIDYDGPCGGYNLANAWLTGIKSGQSVGDRATGR